jgi:hypothetical protein
VFKVKVQRSAAWPCSKRVLVRRSSGADAGKTEIDRNWQPELTHFVHGPKIGRWERRSGVDPNI